MLYSRLCREGEMQARRGALALVVAAVVSWSVGTAAARTDAPILLYGPEGPDPVLEDRALAAYYLQASERRSSVSIRHIDSAFLEQPEVQVYGGGEPQQCSGTPLNEESFTDGLDRAFESLAYVETDEALRELKRLEALLPCLTGVLPRVEIARISFLDGVAEAYAGENERARESFRKAFVVSPDLEWDPSFPPAAEELFVAAMQDALRSPTAQLVVAPLVGHAASLWIDGVSYPTSGGTSDVAEGRHLLQWRSEEDGFVTRIVEVRGGEPVEVLSRDDVSLAAVHGVEGQRAGQIAAEALQAFARSTGRSELYIVELGSVDLLHRFDVASGHWEIADQGLVTRRSRARSLTTAGSVSMIAGAALLVTGTIVGAIGYERASGLYEEGGDISTIDVYTEKFRQYETSRSQTYAGLTIAGIGGAALLVGIPLTATGAKVRRARSSRASVEVVLRPGPMGVALTGSY